VIIGAIGTPLVIHYLSKKEVTFQNPEETKYIAGSLIGITGGYFSGQILGTLTYEVFNQEGNIKKISQREKIISPIMSIMCSD
jgi:hypothetical protein